MKNNPPTPICPMCKNDKVHPLSMNIGFTFRANELSITMPTDTHICNKCGYLMLFIKRNKESEELINWD